MNKVRILAVIPAKKKSVRCEGKNSRLFLGKPIISWTIESAIKSELFSNIVVSTDCEQIQKLAQGYNVQGVKRPKSLCNDDKTLVDVVTHHLLDENVKGQQYDYICCLYATAPMRSAKDIANAWILMQKSNANFCAGVTSVDQRVFSMFSLDGNGYLVHRFSQLPNELEILKSGSFIDNGSMYFAEVSCFLEQQTFLGEKSIGYYMPPQRSIDIDYPHEFIAAEHAAKEILF